MEIKGWRYYNHAVIPTTAPNEKVNMEPLNDGSIWKIGGGLHFLHGGHQIMIVGLRLSGGIA